MYLLKLIHYNYFIIKHFHLIRQEPGLLDRAALENSGNCQRPVFSLGVSPHDHKITNQL